jgi:hypothetical protein
MFDIRAIVFHDDIGVFGELFKDLDPLGVFEIQAHPAFVTMQVLEIESVPIAAHAIAGATARHFNFDGICPPIHKLTDSRRTGTCPSQVQNLDFGEREMAITSHSVYLSCIKVVAKST